MFAYVYVKYTTPYIYINIYIYLYKYNQDIYIGIMKIFIRVRILKSARQPSKENHEVSVSKSVSHMKGVHGRTSLISTFLCSSVVSRMSSSYLNGFIYIIYIYIYIYKRFV